MRTSNSIRTYVAANGGLQLGHRFLVAAHETFTLLSLQPGIECNPRFVSPELMGGRVFSISGFNKMLVFYQNTDCGIEVLRVLHGSRNLQELLSREGLE